MADRKTVFDPPEHIYVLGYVWTNGAASGGRQELFASERDLIRRLEELVEDGKIKDQRCEAFMLYVQDEIKGLEIAWPTGVTLR
jgi:hypothetical protein